MEDFIKIYILYSVGLEYFFVFVSAALYFIEISGKNSESYLV